jgi:hypothetical protein
MAETNDSASTLDGNGLAIFDAGHAFEAQEIDGVKEMLREGGAVFSRARMNLALEAVWEIEALCKAMRAAIAKADSEFQDEFIVRGMTSRVEDLALAASAALCDEVETIKDLSREVVRH